MTRDHDFKDLVRARMARTGERYTQARAALLADDDARATPVRPPAQADVPAPQEPRDTAYEKARREQESVVARFFDGERLRTVPARRKVRASVLLELVRRFEPGRDYSEPEVNALLLAVHEDFAFWRRELVDYGYVQRDAGVYRLAAQAPERAAFFADELPAWEALWLPGYLAGRDRP